MSTTCTPGAAARERRSGHTVTQEHPGELAVPDAGARSDE